MKKLLSLPPNLVESFHDIEQRSRDEWFCTNDPVGRKLGSGGGTTWLLSEAYRHDAEAADGPLTPADWLAAGRRILLHAGGQSRRLPAYAPSGKILTPVPVFRWKRGQRLSQNLLDLQLPLYEQMMEQAPAGLRTMIVSGDVYITASEPLGAIPEADVVCYGLWVDPSLAQNHGVFVSRRTSPDRLDYMLQKPSRTELAALMQTHLFLMDIGVWLLSDRAVELLVRRSTAGGGTEALTFPRSADDIRPYDLYGEFGLALGEHPRIADPELNALTVAILPLPGGEFHHYGTSREMISSTLAVQNSVIDQRAIMQHKVKPHPAIFVQNARVDVHLTPANSDVWVENSHVAAGWELTERNIVTGVPRNDWALRLAPGLCIDVVPVGADAYAARPYGMGDAFKGALADGPLYQGRPVTEWLAERGLTTADVEGAHDLQAARLFPVTADVGALGVLLRWMTSEPELAEGRALWLASPKLSADELSARADLRRLTAQREQFRRDNWAELAAHHERSVFYQLNLDDAATQFARLGLAMPAPLAADAPRMKQIQDAMFRSRLCALRGEADTAQRHEERAFGLMREGLTDAIAARQQTPRLSVYADQIVWSRSPVRIDLAGGWTDTPPYSLMQGGNVVNIAIELNGQPPLQVYVKPSREPKIILRSIDLGASETITSVEELTQFNRVGSPFSIPKAALVLAGFGRADVPLVQQLRDFGAGIELTMLSAIPAGSGLGTSSILASTVLGALGEFCGLGWDKYDISNRTLVLEQLLTTGGGWQDQYGGVLHGAKLLQTQPGWTQQPIVRWLPDTLWTHPDYRKLHLLYYTGITRTAKGILAEIVRGMFLNSSQHLALLDRMKTHALDLHDAVQLGDFTQMGRLVRKTWTQNQLLDAGTNPPAVRALTDRIDDLCLGYKLPGAGGGGYLYMVAKDEEAALRIRHILNQNPPNDKARFVEMTLSTKGMEISKS